MNEVKEIFLRLKIGFVILIVVFIIGTIGFFHLEDSADSYLDSFYYTLVTISTVGYGDVTPQTQNGKILAIIIIFFGVGSVFVTIPTFFELIIQREIKEVFKLPDEINKLKDHIIICGWGKVGKSLVDSLDRSDKSKYVIIEVNPHRIKHLVDRHFNVIEGEACSEDALERANITAAKTLISTLDDADNVFVTLTAKTMNPDIRVICKVDYFVNESKLRKAGADEVINCHDIGAQKMLSMIS